MLLKDEKNGTFDSNVGYVPLPASIKKRIKYLASNFSKKEIRDALTCYMELIKEKSHRL